jgi:site-specific recombinase XerC
VEKPFVVLNSIAGARIGPLADHLNAYLSLVRGQGYAPGSARIQVQVIARFSQWLRRKGMEVCDLDQSVVERFLQGHRDARSASRGDAATLNRLLRMLRQNGVTREERRAAPSRLEKIAEDYRRYLLQERGLSQATAVNYLPFIDQFLFERFEGGRLNLSQLRAPDVTSFVQRHARDFSPGRGKLLVTALRSFLRHLRHQGKIQTDLAACVPAVAWWSFATMPKFLPASDVQKVLKDCDRQTAIGRRNYAILLLLARLGLRAGEVVSLNLEEIDWDNGHVTVRAKGGRWSQLPLPAEVGEAIAVYLRQDRPRGSCRRVFLRHRAPFVGLANSMAISQVWIPCARARTYSVMDWRRRCSARVPRSTRLATCSVTRAPTRLQSTPRWTWLPSARWRFPGREALDENAAASHRRLSLATTWPGIQAGKT